MLELDGAGRKIRWANLTQRSIVWPKLKSCLTYLKVRMVVRLRQ